MAPSRSASALSERDAVQVFRQSKPFLRHGHGPIPQREGSHTVPGAREGADHQLLCPLAVTRAQVPRQGRRSQTEQAEEHVQAPYLREESQPTGVDVAAAAASGAPEQPVAPKHRGRREGSACEPATEDLQQPKRGQGRRVADGQLRTDERESGRRLQLEAVTSGDTADDSRASVSDCTVR